MVKPSGVHSLDGALVRRWALALYAVALVGLWLSAPADLLTKHTPYNHFALLAESWQAGRLSLEAGPPDYAHNNDFAVYGGKTFISFPPFPAVVLVPAVWLAGSAENVRDGLWFLPLAAAVPSVLFFALLRLRELRLSALSVPESGALALAFVFATVFWFSSVQGTVWFAAHVVGALLAAGYLTCALGAGSPLLAGVLLGLAIATRTSLLFAAPLFFFELWRAQPRDKPLDPRALLGPALRFTTPIGAVLLLLAWHNHARFDDAFEFGHRHLDVVWQPRIQKWGLFSTHFLGRNLGVLLASLPLSATDTAPFRITGHGLALWITSPFYLLLLMSRPRRANRAAALFGLGLTTALVALPSLLYQNSGWVQFGYRFSNDYAVFLFAMLAILLSDRPKLRPAFWSLVACAVLINAFGALTFGRSEHANYYAYELPARVIFEPD